MYIWVDILSNYTNMLLIGFSGNQLTLTLRVVAQGLLESALGRYACKEGRKAGLVTGIS